jgi:uncharacterized phage protein (TIGR02218 family)
VSATIDGVLYDSAPGIDASNLVISSGLDVGNIELSTVDDGSVFTAEEFLAGSWNNAEFEIFRYDYLLPSAGKDILLVGHFGELKRMRGKLSVELRDLRQFMQQPVGDPSTKTCRARLGDSRCGKDLSTFTHTGAVSSVTSSQVFTGSSGSPSFSADYFGEGQITFTTGSNAGRSFKVRAYDQATDQFTLALRTWANLQIGDEYVAVAGCRKRLQEDCRDKFDNVLNFVGEPHRPTLDSLTANPA